MEDRSSANISYPASKTSTSAAKDTDSATVTNSTVVDLPSAEGLVSDGPTGIESVGASGGEHQPNGAEGVTEFSVVEPEVVVLAQEAGRNGADTMRQRQVNGCDSVRHQSQQQSDGGGSTFAAVRSGSRSFNARTDDPLSIGLSAPTPSIVAEALHQIASSSIPAAAACLLVSPAVGNPPNGVGVGSVLTSGIGTRRTSSVSRTLLAGRRSSAANAIINVARTIKQQGREFESVYTNHRYTARELDVLASYDSFDYLPGHSTVYQQWLQRQPARLDWDRWLVMGLIGTTVGLVGFLLHQITHLVSDIKWHRAEQLIQDRRMIAAWMWTVGYSVVITAASAASVSFVYRPAGGSGIPEVIGFLNGTVMRHVLNLPAFCVKFFSCSTAVGAGLPVGPEGPMIHIGSIVGTGLSQFQSRTFNIVLPLFTRFRNSEDRRNFTTAGAAAGVAAAFGAPVGGLLFAMEEVSSFWSMKLGWMIFFCCMLATFTADLFNSSLDGFKVDGLFGLFQTDKYIVFKLGSAIPVNIIMFLPAMLIGFIGGVLGALFTVVNLKIARLRRRILSKLRRPHAQRIARFIEPPIIMLLWATITLFLPAAFPCKPMVCRQSNAQPQLSNASNYSYSRVIRSPDDDVTGSGSIHCLSTDTAYYTDEHVQRYWCQKSTNANESHITADEYNEVASLLNVNVHQALRLLFSRRTHYQFSYDSLLTVLPIYFFVSCWASGSAVASGIVVPMLFIGGLYGRAIGRLLVDAHGGIPIDVFWQWIDPGAMALIGAASFFGGVSRLTMSLAVIMIEITNDVAFLLPIMVAILVSKWVGDYITHPLYYSLLEFKCIPFLDCEPLVYDDHHNVLNLELFKARDVMHRPVVTITPRESLSHLARLILETKHGGFPVVKYYEKSRHEVAYGLITRTELCVILSHPETRSVQTSGTTITPKIPYEELSVERLSDKVKIAQILEDYSRKAIYSNIFIDLEPFINRSAPHINDEFSLHRTYIVFRTLGLRHLVVVDMSNRIVGIITRKDLMGFNLERKLEQRKQRGFSLEGGSLRLLPSERFFTPPGSSLSGCVGGRESRMASSSLTSSLTAVDAIRTSGEAIV